MEVMSGPRPHCPARKGCLKWVQKYLLDCVCSRRDRFSLALGLMSVACWGVAEVPQIITNFRDKSTEGVSLLFLMTWVVGDVFNLLGCYLEPATLPTQFLMATLYTLTTIVLVLQVLFYDHLLRWRTKEGALTATLFPEMLKADVESQKPLAIPESPHQHQGFGSASQPTSIRVPRHHRHGSRGQSIIQSARSLASSYAQPMGSEGQQQPPVLELHRRSLPNLSSFVLRVMVSSMLVVGLLGVGLYVRPSAFPGGTTVGATLLRGRAPLGNAFLREEPSPLGEVFGWIMAGIYICGRIPQIWLNMKRGSVEGLNPLMFVFVLLANATYIGSILVRSLEWQQLKPNMAWLVDAAVCIILDIFILYQCAYYYLKAKKDILSEEEELGLYKPLN